ncbi:transposase and inactivated derivative, partial [Paenibacillus popilliae ATCC 14706]
GSSTILRIFMQPLRPSIQSKATERFETAPGEQAQVNWGRLQDLNRQVRHWLDTVANQRLHGTTFRVPDGAGD